LRPYVAVLAMALALLLVGEIATRAWVRASEPSQLRWYDASTQIRVEGFDETGTRSVVFAGTSMAWQGFVPAEFSSADPLDRTAFNAGLAGGVPIVTEPWLLEHVVPALEPDTVVWGLSSLDFSSSYGKANYAAFTQALESKPGLLGGIERGVSGSSALIQWRATLRNPSSWLGYSGDQVDRDLAAARSTLGPDGERLDFSIAIDARRAAVQRSRLADMALDASDVASVLRTIDELQELGVEVVLVQLPVPDRFAQLHPGGRADVERVHALVEAIGIDTNSQVIDLSDGFTDDDFVDFTHLNAAAAARLTQRLAAEIGTT